MRKSLRRNKKQNDSSTENHVGRRSVHGKRADQQSCFPEDAFSAAHFWPSVELKGVRTIPEHTFAAATKVCHPVAVCRPHAGNETTRLGSEAENERPGLACRSAGARRVGRASHRLGRRVRPGHFLLFSFSFLHLPREATPARSAASMRRPTSSPSNSEFSVNFTAAGVSLVGGCAGDYSANARSMV
jgi:hypothetical protein